MKIAIIGAGSVGTAIGTAAVAAGNEVVITATDAGKAERVAQDIGAAAARSNPEAVADADMVVLAVPFSAVDGIAKEISDAVSGKVVVDVTNPLASDMSGLAVTEGAGAQQVQAALPQASVVKAFNTVLAANQAEPTRHEIPLDGFYAGDDDAAKARVADLLASIGFRPIDAGNLAAARALDEMAFLNITLNIRNNWPWQTGWKLVGPVG